MIGESVMKKFSKKISSLIAASMIINLVSAVTIAYNPIIEYKFNDIGSVSDWSNNSNITVSENDVVGGYALIDGDSAVSAPRTPDFEVTGDVCVEFDMMIPTNKADQTTPNAIGGGATGGLALMEGTTVAGVIGFRGSGQGTPDHVLSMGDSRNPVYLNAVAGSKATAYRDQWLHYVMMVNTENKTGDVYIINPEDKTVYNHENTFDSYIKNISSLTNIGVVSNTQYTIGLANLSVYNPEPTEVRIMAEDDTVVQYLPGEGNVSTVQYYAEALRVLSYNLNGEYLPTSEKVLMPNADIEYAIYDLEGQEAAGGITISDTGLLQINSYAEPGNYTVMVKSGNLTSSMPLEIKSAGFAVRADIYGTDEVIIGQSDKYQYKILPVADTGAVLPDKETEWEIIGDSLGCSINSSGELTVGTSTGKITIKATIIENNISSEIDVYIRSQSDISSAPIEIKGIILSTGDLEINGGKISDIAIKSNAEIQNAEIRVKSYDKYNLILNDIQINAGNLSKGAYCISLNDIIDLGESERVRVIITDGFNRVISGKTIDLEKGIYKGIPLVGDWHMNPEVGIGASANAGPPAGIDPEIVNTSNYNVNYKYDNNYKQITEDNILWYKTGAYHSSSNIYQQHSRDWEQQALPIGNGYMGGMIFGMPGKDQIQFNEETFWAGGYRGLQDEVTSSTINPDMGEGINSFMNAGNIFIDFGVPGGASVTNYYRDLNLDEAVAHVEYTYNNVKYNREYFASYPAESMIFRYSADKKIR